MSLVLYDRAIRFEGRIYTVVVTHHAPPIIITVDPHNSALKALVEDLLTRTGRITLDWRDGCFEIVKDQA